MDAWSHWLPEVFRTHRNGQHQRWGRHGAVREMRFRVSVFGIARRSGLGYWQVSEPPPGASCHVTPGGFEAYVALRSWYGLPSVIAVAWLTAMTTGFVELPAGGMVAAGLAAVLTVANAGAMIFGRITIRREGNSATVHTGWGPIGWTRRFQWDSILSATEAQAKGRASFETQVGCAIVLTMRPGTSTRHIPFGNLITDERRWFLLAAIRRELIRSAGQRRP